MTAMLQKPAVPVQLPPCLSDPDRWATAGDDAEPKALCRSCPRRRRCAGEAISIPGISGIVAGVHIPEGGRPRTFALRQLRAVAALAGQAGEPESER